MLAATRFTVLLMLFAPLVLAQEKKEVKHAMTKMEAFTSKTGTITKFVDFKMPSLKLFLGEVAETRVRKIIVGNELKYFYLIEKESKNASTTASIEYYDLLEVIKALSVLKGESAADRAGKPDYLENKFVTPDGFQLGYYVSEGEGKWYMKFDQHGTDNTVFINDVQTIEISLTAAKNKIEEMTHRQ
jgi:hypothetical protein